MRNALGDDDNSYMVGYWLGDDGRNGCLDGWMEFIFTMEVVIVCINIRYHLHIYEIYTIWEFSNQTISCTLTSSNTLCIFCLSTLCQRLPLPITVCASPLNKIVESKQTPTHTTPHLESLPDFLSHPSGMYVCIYVHKYVHNEETKRKKEQADESEQTTGGGGAL